jgi:hypothetical protein
MHPAVFLAKPSNSFAVSEPPYPYSGCGRMSRMTRTLSLARVKRMMREPEIQIGKSVRIIPTKGYSPKVVMMNRTLLCRSIAKPQRGCLIEKGEYPCSQLGFVYV